MKYSEFHRKIRRNGWKLSFGEGKGSHYIYEKEDPQHVYQYVDEDTIGTIVGLRKKNDKGKYKITMNK